MSKTIDERVVSMQFDNKQFEEETKKTLTSLKSLKKEMEFKDADKGFKQVTKGFEEISAASDKTDLSGLQQGIEQVRVKFGLMESVALNVLNGIASTAINVGTSLVKSLSVDNIAAGWNKLSLKTSSVQTIMNATGKSMDEVNKYLEKLMWYSDETSYGFTDMTQALGQLTAAGGDIDKLMPMITGIANATAYAGKGANEFSRSIYNLNQSYGAGHLQYMDWRSLELAGTASKQLKETFIETGIELGKIKEGQVNVANFSETLKDKWADQEVMEKAFSKFSTLSDAAYKAVQSGEYDNVYEAIDALKGKYGELGDKAFTAAQEAKTLNEAIEATQDAASSKWMTTFEHIVGNYEQQKVLWTDLCEDLYTIFIDSLDDRNKMLEKWSEMGGRDSLIGGFKNIMKGIVNLVVNFREAMHDIFPPTTAEQFLAFSIGFQKFTESLLMSEETSGKFKDTIRGLFSILSILLQPVKAIFSLMKPGVPMLRAIAGVLLDITSAVGRALTSVDTALKKSGLLEFIDKISTKISEFVSKFCGNLLGGLRQAAEEAGNKIKEFWEKLFPKKNQNADGALESVSQFSTFIEKLGAIARNVVKALQPLTDAIKKVFDSFFEFLASGKLSMLFNALNNFSFSAAFFGISSNITRISNAIGKTTKSFGKTLQTASNQLNKSFKGFSGIFKRGSKTINEGTEEIFEVLTKNTKKRGLLGLFTGRNSIFEQVKSTLKAYERDINANILKKVANAILIFAGAMFLLATIDPGRLAASTVAIGALFAMLNTSLKTVQMVGSAKGGIKGLMANFVSMAKVMTGVVVIASSVVALASALKIVSTIDTAGMIRGLAAIGILLVMVIKTFDVIDKMSTISKADAENITSRVTMLQATMTLTTIANTVKTLAEVLLPISNLSWEQLAKGLSGITLLMGELTAFLWAINNISPMNGRKAASAMGTLVSLVGVTVAIKMLSKDLKAIGEMDANKMVQGLEGMGVMMAELAVFCVAINHNAPKFGSALGSFVIISAAILAIKVITDAVKQLGAIDDLALGKGILGLAGIMTSISAFIFTLGKVTSEVSAKSLVSSAILITMIGQFIKTIGETIQGLGSLEFENVATALAGIAPILGSMISTMLLVEKINVVDFVKASAAFLLLGASLKIIASSFKTLSGVSWEGIGKSLAGFAGALVVLGAASWALSALNLPLMAFAKTLLVISASIFIASAGFVAMSIAMTTFVGALSSGFQQAGVTIKALIQSFFDSIDIIVKGLPRLGELAIEFIKMILDVFVDATPRIVEAVMKVLVEVTKQLAEYAPVLCENFFQFFLGLMDKLTEYIPQMVIKASEFLSKLFSAFIEAARNFNSLSIEKLVVALAEISGLMLICKGLTYIAGGAMVGLLELGVFIAELGVVLMALGALGAIPGVTWFIGKGGELLEAIGTAIGKFVGGIAGGVAIGYSDGLPEFGENLSLFMENLRPFIDLATQLDGDIVKNVKTLAEALAIISHTKWSNSEEDIVAFGNSLENLGDQLAKFSSAVTKEDAVNLEAVKNAAEALKIISEVAKNLPNDGGVVGWFMGENNLGEFASKLESVGQGIKAFADETKDVKPENIQNGVDGLVALTKIAKEIPNSGGIVSWFSGDNDLASFSAQIGTLGKAMGQFNTDVGLFSKYKAQNAVDAVDLFIQLLKRLPKKRSWDGFWSGEMTLNDMANELANFATPMTRFAENLGTITTSDTNSAKNAAAVIEAMAGSFDAIQGKKFGTVTGLSSMFQELSKAAPDIKKFATDIEGFKTDSIPATTRAINQISRMIKELPDFDGKTSNWATGEVTLTKLGEELSNFGPKIADFSAAVKGNVDVAGVEAASNAGKMMSELAKNLLPTDLDGFKGWFTSQYSLSSFGKELVSFGRYINIFSTVISTGDGINVTQVENAAKAGKAMSELANNLGVDPENNPIKQSMTNWAKDLTNFAIKFVEFSQKIAGIDEQGVAGIEQATKLSNGLLELKMPTKQVDYSGLRDHVMTLSEFASDLYTFSIHFRNFSGAFEDINLDGVDKVTGALSSLVDIANNMPVINAKGSTEGVKQTLSAFGGDLKDLGPNLGTFVDSAKDIDAEGLKSAKPVLEAFAELARIDFSGIIYDANSNKAMTDFAAAMVDFAPELIEFSDTIGAGEWCDADAIQNIANATKPMVELANSLGTSGGWLENIVGKKDDMAKFGEAMSSFGGSFVAFCESINGISDFTNVNACVTAMNSFASLNTSVLGEGINIDLFGAALESLGTSVASFATSTFGITFETFDPVVNAINAIVETCMTISQVNADVIASFSASLENIGINGVNNLVRAIDQGSVSQVQPAIEGMLNRMVEAIQTGSGNVINQLRTLVQDIRDYAPNFESAGTDLANGIKNGLGNDKVDYTSRVKTKLSAACITIKGYYSDFYSAGEYVASGLASGIANGSSGAIAAAERIANATLSKFKKTFQEQSPSKATKKIGAFVSEGLAIGIEQAGDKAVNSAGNLADGILYSMRNSLQAAKELKFEEDDIPSPVITPIVDITGAVSNAQSLSAALDFGRSIDTKTTVDRTEQVKLEIQNDEMAKAETISRLGSAFDNFVNQINGENKPIELHNHLYMNARELAHETAPYTQKEINALDALNLRLKGVKR